MAFLVFDDHHALTHQDDEVLLHRLRVVQTRRLTLQRVRVCRIPDRGSAVDREWSVGLGPSPRRSLLSTMV